MVIPSPAQGAALQYLGMLRTDEMPMLAAHWLIDFDSPALRRLAGLNGSEGWLIDQLWAAVLIDLGVWELSSEQAWGLAISYQSAALNAGERSVTEIMHQVIRAYIKADYPAHPPEAGDLYGLDDELQCGWGRAPEGVLADAQRTLTQWAPRTSPT